MNKKEGVKLLSKRRLAADKQIITQSKAVTTINVLWQEVTSRCGKQRRDETSPSSVNEGNEGIFTTWQMALAFVTGDLQNLWTLLRQGPVQPVGGCCSGI